MHPYKVHLDPTTLQPRYQKLGIMERWCEQHAPGAWSHPLHVEHWGSEHDPQSYSVPKYDHFHFADKRIAALFKLTFWKPQ